MPTPLLALDCIVLDTETTGLDARKARIIEIALVPVVHASVRAAESWQSYIDPGEKIPAASMAVHHITDDMVRGAPTFAEIADELERRIGKAIVVGHSIDYDLALLRREYTIAGRKMPQLREIDVRVLGELAAPTLADHSLQSLCEWLEVTNAQRHRATGDAVATAEILVGLLPRLRARGIRTLAEAEAAARLLGERHARAAGGSMAMVDLGSGAASDSANVLSGIDSFPYRHRVRDVMSAPARYAARGATVRDALGGVLRGRISSLLVELEDGSSGIVTDRDLLREIDRDPIAGLATPLVKVARRPLQTVAADDFVYRVIGRAERLGIRHVAVRGEEGAIVGMISTRSLLRQRATTAIVLGDEIDHAESAAGLAVAWGKLIPMARSLMSEDVDPRTVCAVISAEICAMTRRAAELAEASLAAEGAGPPPVPYAVLVLGSAGRGESQLAADQDNAIVYARGGEGGAEDRWFEQLAIRMCDMLDAAGVPNCKGGVMARNRAWRMSIEDWLATVDVWIRRQRPEDLLNVDIFFDAVPVHGEQVLAEQVLEHALARGRTSPSFTKLLTEVARQKSPAFTLFGRLRADEKGRLDLKRAGLMPIFTAARVLAIRHGVAARSTVDRLTGVEAAGIGSPAITEAITSAHRTLLAAVLAQQLRDAEAGRPLTPTVVVAELDKAGKARLSRALHDVDEAIGLISEGRL